MRQSWYSRTLGALMLPLYAMGAWIAPALQVCPMHGSPVAAHAAMQSDGVLLSAQSMSAESIPGMAGHAAHGNADVATVEGAVVTESDAPAGTHTHGCDCLGSCAGSNGPAAPETQLAFVVPTNRKHEPFEMKNAEVVVMHLAHMLPFATAPPKTLA